MRSWMIRVAESAVLPSNTSTAAGRPWALHSRPNTICALPRWPSREQPRHQQGAAAFDQVEVTAVEHQGAIGEMPLGQLLLKRPLAFQQPVRCIVERVRVHRARSERLAQRLAAQAVRSGQLGVLLEHAGRAQGPPPARAGARAWRRAAGRAEGAPGPSPAATWPWVLERTLRQASSGATRVAFWSSRGRISILARPAGEFGEGPLADALSLAPALPEEAGGVRIAVRDGLDLHGNYHSRIVLRTSFAKSNCKQPINRINCLRCLFVQLLMKTFSISTLQQT